MASEDRGQQREAMQRIAEARVKTGDFIARLMMAYAGFAAFCVFALLSPDRLMIEPKASIDMPFAGTVSFLAFMLVAPVVLIGMRVYLEVYVQHWRHLDAQLDAASEPKTVSPLKHPLLRRFSVVVLYPLLPAMLALFTWKTAAKDVWGDAFSFLTLGDAFLFLTLVCATAQLYAFIRRAWFSRAAQIAVVSGSLFAAGLSAGGIPHRGLELARENLEVAYLVGEDLRLAVLVGANLTGADLSGAVLSGAVLWSANLTGANLMLAKLTDADLSGANLTNANLTEANLTDADVSGANLTDAYASGANLTDADVTYANLTDADVTNANLTFASLRYADLSGADLWNANLMGADLTGTNLTGADLADANNLTQEQLDSACISKDGTPPALPEGEDLKPPRKVCGP